MGTLPVGLAHALLDVERRFGDSPSLVLWSDLLRVVPDGGIPVGSLPTAARIPRRAVRMWLGVEAGRSVDVADKRVRLTASGRRLRDAGADRMATVSPAWGDRLRAPLEALVAAIDVELPHYPMVYGTDPSATGGTAVAAKPGPPRIPAHGTDWVPVVRDGDTATGLPLPALISQALMAFTIDYEERARFPMAVTALLPPDPVPLGSLPGALGVTGSGRSLLERHGVVTVTGTGKRRMASLTPTGRYLRDSHDRTVAEVVRSWRERYGDALIDRLSAALTPVPDDLPDHVLVRFVPGRGFVGPLSP